MGTLLDKIKKFNQDQWIDFLHVLMAVITCPVFSWYFNDHPHLRNGCTELLFFLAIAQHLIFSRKQNSRKMVPWLTTIAICCWINNLFFGGADDFIQWLRSLFISGRDAIINLRQYNDLYYYLLISGIVFVALYFVFSIVNRGDVRTKGTCRLPTPPEWFQVSAWILGLLSIILLINKIFDVFAGIGDFIKMLQSLSVKGAYSGKSA